VIISKKEQTMPSRAQIVEAALGVKVPKQYERFLNQYGIYRTFGIEVFGIDDDLLSYEGIPCVIGATKIYRKEYSYPHRLLVLHYTGFEDEFICLDTENEKIYAMSRYTGNRKIADSFDEWFNRDILPRRKKKK
jgi:hypothetical protein